MANVPCNCFMPRPNVDSAVIRLTRYEEPPVQVKDEKMLFKLSERLLTSAARHFRMA